MIRRTIAVVALFAFLAAWEVSNNAGRSFAIGVVFADPLGVPVGRTDLAVIPISDLPRPPLGVPYLDEVAALGVMRRTDPTMQPPNPTNPPLGLRHEYISFQGINADNTMIIVMNLGGGNAGAFEVRKIVDGSFVGDLPLQGDAIDPGWTFHRTDPNLVMGLVNNTIVIRNVATETTTVVVTLPQYATLNNGGKGHMDDAWTYWAGFGVRPNPDGSPNWNEKDLICVDLTTGMIVGLVPYNDPGVSAAAWLGMSPSGEYIVVVNFDFPDGTYPGTKVYGRDFSGERLIQPTYSHGDFVVDAAGQEHYVYFAENGPDGDEFFEKVAGVDYDGIDLSKADAGFAVVAARLSDARKRVLAVLPWEVAVHASGLATRTRPYVLLSTYVDPTFEHAVYTREVFWLALDGSGTIVRVAHHHSDPVLAGPMGKDYFAEPHAIPSMDGSLVVWCSVWNDEFTHYDTYVMWQPWR